jgi:hypothetical protein
MDQNDVLEEILRSLDHHTEWSQAELALFQGVALLGTALIGVLHVVDAVVEAWPLPISRPPRRKRRR